MILNKKKTKKYTLSIKWLPLEIDYKGVFKIAELEYKSSQHLIRDSISKFINFLRLASKCKYRYYFDDNKKNYDMIFFYGLSFFRNDMKKRFDKFVSYFPYGLSLTVEEVDNVRFNIIKFIISFIHCFVWIIELISNGFNFFEAIFLLPCLQSCYTVYSLPNEIVNNKVPLLCVFSQMTPDENFLIQIHKKLGSKTATLQHGVFFYDKLSDNLFNGVELLNSCVDYFLIWNEFTYDQAVDAGIDHEKLYILGMPQFINFKTIKRCSSDKIFGIVLNGYTDDFHIQNLKMLEIANLFSKKFGWKYTLRYHPNMSKNYYAGCLNDCFIDLDMSSISLDEYSNKVSFSIVSASSVFFELIYLNHPTVRLAGGIPGLKTEYNTFKNVMQLNELIKDGILEINEDEFFYLCGTHDVLNSYDHFFKGVISDAIK